MKKVTIAVFIFAAFVQAYGQGNTFRNNTSNSNAWFMYFGNHQFTKRFGLHAEVQLRRHDVISDQQQLLLRGGLDVYLNGNGRFTAGYGFIKTHPYGEFAVARAFPEHRTWQQFLTSQSLGKLKLAHRYRLEQRWIGNAATGAFKNGRYENRIRYMAKLTLPIFTSWERPLFVAAYDEVMINFGKEVGYNVFDQNRLYGALGISASSNIKVEVGYLYQLVKLRTLDGDSRNRIENNHTLQLGVFSTLPFRNTNAE